MTDAGRVGRYTPKLATVLAVMLVTVSVLPGAQAVHQDDPLGDHDPDVYAEWLNYVDWDSVNESLIPDPYVEILDRVDPHDVEDQDLPTVKLDSIHQGWPITSGACKSALSVNSLTGTRVNATMCYTYTGFNGDEWCDVNFEWRFDGGLFPAVPYYLWWHGGWDAPNDSHGSHTWDGDKYLVTATDPTEMLQQFDEDALVPPVELSISQGKVVTSVPGLENVDRAKVGSSISLTCEG